MNEQDLEFAQKKGVDVLWWDNKRGWIAFVDDPLCADAIKTAKKYNVCYLKTLIKYLKANNIKINN